ncbi:hypothetical protein ACVW00_003017 [Marmoricola sp. URHA0025 HA25]
MDAIDSYLDELAVRLRVGPARARRLLAEAEEHLRETTAREPDAGADDALAQERAIQRFGTARQVAAAANDPVVSRLAPLVLGAAHLTAVGSVAVLAGTLLAQVVAAASSRATAFGLPHGYLPSHAQVAHWVAVQPGAAGWRSAAAAENADDTLVLRGVLALLVLLASLLVLRVGRRRTSQPADGVVPAIGMTAFGGAAVVLLAAAVADTYTPLEWGRGLLFSDGAVALVAAAAYGVVLVRRVQTA